MDISGTDPDANYTRSKGSNPTTVTDTNLPVNIYSNNCFFGFTSAGGFPAYADFPTLSGNLHDTDPQILAPAQNRWGLRQNSPCVNNGNKNTVEF